MDRNLARGAHWAIVDKGRDGGMDLYVTGLQYDRNDGVPTSWTLGPERFAYRTTRHWALKVARIIRGHRSKRDARYIVTRYLEA